MHLRQVSEQLQRLVDNTLEREKYIHNIVLGVAFDDGEFNWSGAAGVADAAAGSAMQAETPFLIASVTKMYTAAAVMMLQERGRLQLGDQIGKYLPDGLIQGLHHYQGKDYTSQLTIRHLISQTSGLPDYFLEKPKNGKSVLDRILAEGDREWDLDDVVALTRQEFPARFPPAAFAAGNGGSRTKAHYSDTNYKLLGAIIESVTQQPLHAVFEAFFFEPLNLGQTCLYGYANADSILEPAQVFYQERPLTIDRLMRTHGPEGGIVATVDDTLRFGQAFMSGELFASQDTLETMQQWNPIFFPLQYGYGLMRFKVPRLLAPFGYNPELIGHSGSSGSFLYYCRDLNLYLSGTINQVALRNAPFRLMIKAAQIFKRVSP